MTQTNYLKQIRDRLTHSDKNSSKNDIKSFKLTHVPGYSLPEFKAQQNIELCESDLDAIMVEIRETLEAV